MQAMISDSQVRSVALFFLLAFMDEKIALPAADRAIATLKNKIGRFAEESADAKRILVSVCAAQYFKSKKLVERGQPSPTLGSVLQTPREIDLKAWSQFQKEAADDELLTVLFGRILGINTTDIAIALSVTEGTAHYRLSRAVRRLGELERSIHPGEA